MESNPNRRRILELAGTGTALSLAGCSALQSAPETDTDPQAVTEPQETTAETDEDTETTADSTETTTDGSSGGDETVTVVVQVDQQALQQRQQEIRSEVEAGNISRAEAQERIRSAQSELRSAAVASFRERAGSTPDLAVADSIDQFGVVLVSGSATALIDALSFAEVQALVAADAFQRLQARADAQTETSTQTQTSSN